MMKPYFRVLSTLDKLLWVGRSIIYNRATPKHRDKRDKHDAWTPLITLGNSKGGDFYIPALAEEFYYEPGTILFVRGGAMEHGVRPFWGGQRIAIAHFTHYYIWKELGDVDLLSPPP